MMEVMIDFTKQEQEMAEKYALKQGITLEEVLKTAFLEKISKEMEEMVEKGVKA